MEKDLETLRRERAEAEAAYAEALDLLDRLHKIKELPPQLEQLRAKLNEVLQREGRRDKLFQKLFPSQLEALSLITQIFNLLLPHLLELNSRLIEILHHQIVYFQRLMPLIDTKDREWFAKSLQEGENLRRQARQQLDVISTLLNTLKQLSLPEVKPAEKAESFFYYWFERKFRDEDIKETFKNYLPFLKGKGPVLDFGCGRGEMLELLKEEGIEAMGVDINEEFVRVCRQKGLACEKADGIEFLEKLPDESLGAVFSAQVLEHFPPKAIEKIIALAYRKVRRGGVFIAETVNVACPVAFFSAYLLDPTHQTPLHPLTLKFLLESAGWRVEKILWLNLAPQLQEFVAHNEREAVVRENFKRINDFLYSFMDYAVVAIKS